MVLQCIQEFLSFTSDAFLNAAFISSTVTFLHTSQTNSVHETVRVGTLMSTPFNFPFNSGNN